MSEMDTTLQPKLRYAGLALRFAALALDLLLLGFVFFPITRIVKGVWLMGREDHLWSYSWIVTDPLCVSFLVAGGLYFLLLEGTWGATIGKRIVGLQVVHVDGSRPGFRRAAIRNLLRAVDALPALNILGVILIARSPERARLGDRVAGTRVIVRH